MQTIYLVLGTSYDHEVEPIDTILVTVPGMARHLIPYATNNQQQHYFFPFYNEK